MEKELSFRPHHFLCALCFQGRGYSPAFVANFQGIMSALNAENGGDQTIQIVSHTDSICAPCPHRRDKACANQSKITRLDTAHAEALDLSARTSLSWNEAKALIKEKLTLDKFHEICDTCEWKQYGICESVLKEHLKD